MHENRDYSRRTNSDQVTSASAKLRRVSAIDAARLLSHTLGEEESSDFLLGAIADPLLKQASIEDRVNNVHLPIHFVAPFKKPAVVDNRRSVPIIPADLLCNVSAPE